MSASIIAVPVAREWLVSVLGFAFTELGLQDEAVLRRVRSPAASPDVTSVTSPSRRPSSTGRGSKPSASRTNTTVRSSSVCSASLRMASGTSAWRA